MKNGYGDHFKKLKEQKGLHGPSSVSTPAEQIRSRIKERHARLKKVKAKKRFPLRAVLTSLIGAAIAGFGMMYHEQIDHLITKVEVGFLGEAHAQAPAPAKAAETPKGDAASKVVDKPVEKTEAASDDIDHMLKLTDRKKALDLREEELNRLEAELVKQRDEIEKKLKTLEDTRTGISTVLQERAVKDSEKVDTLVQMYSNMKPAQAAKVLESMDEDLAVEIVGRMKKKNAAEVMNLMKSEKAQVFSEKYAGYRKR